MRNRAGFSLISILVCLGVIMVMTNYTLSIDSNTIIDDLTDDELKAQAYMIDCALSQYASSHAGEYPDSLQILIESKILSDIPSIKDYTYITNNANQAYKLSIKLNSNIVYTSPLSTI